MTVSSIYEKTDYTNLFRPNLFTLFPNLTEIRINIHSPQSELLFPSLQKVNVSLYSDADEHIHEYGFSFQSFKMLYSKVKDWKPSTKVILSFNKGIFVKDNLKAIKSILCDFQLSFNEKRKQSCIVDSTGHNQQIQVDDLIIGRKT